MDNTIVQFPNREVPPEGYSEDNVDKRHSEAFRDLEGQISDCVTMAWLALQQVGNASGVPGEVIFTVAHTHQMLAKLQADYYAAYHDEKRP